MVAPLTEDQLTYTYEAYAVEAVGVGGVSAADADNIPQMDVIPNINILISCFVFFIVVYPFLFEELCLKLHDWLLPTQLHARHQ